MKEAMMMLLIAVAILSMPFIVATYLRVANRALASAPEAWSHVERYAGLLLEDRNLAPDVGDLVETLIHKVGDGRLTRRVLAALLFRRGRRQDLPRVWHQMNPQQADQFAHLMVAALFFDSLKTPVRGVLLRQLIYWLAAAATDRAVPVGQAQVMPVVRASAEYCPAQ